MPAARQIDSGRHAMTRDHLKMLLAVATVAAIYLAWSAETGWIPHDEGTLGQAAERVLLGELPHLDFDDPYTGGLSFLHAAAFGVFGVRLTVLRWLLYASTLAFVVALYALASRAARPATAGAVTLLALAWGPPVYFAALPSWYNLFCATFGTVALCRHVETGRRRWLVAAGAAAGASVVIKSIGLFYLAAALLFLVYREQEASASEPATPRSIGLFSWLLLAGLGSFWLLLARLVLLRPSVAAIYHFVIPATVLVGFLAWNEIRRPRDGSVERCRRLAGSAGVLLAGAALPVGLFLVPYVAASAVDELLHGVFVRPLKRFDSVAVAMPEVATFAAALPLVALLVVPLLGRRVAFPAGGAKRVAALAALPAAALLAAGGETPIYRAVWHSVRPLGTVAVVLGVYLVARADLSARRRQRLFLLAASTAMVALVQFPNGFGIYFCYAAPLLIVTLLHVVAAQPRAPRRLLAIAVVFYLFFAAVWVHRGLKLTTGERYWPIEEDTRLDLDRGGLLTVPRLAAVYQRLVDVVQRHSPPGAYVYAAPDCPEVYFLSGRRNPTRTFFDLFDDDFDDPERRRKRLLATLEDRRIDVVVACTRASFSGGVDDRLAAELARRYPHREELPSFVVRWR